MALQQSRGFGLEQDETVHNAPPNPADPSWTTPTSPPMRRSRNNSGDTVSLDSMRKRSLFFGRSNSDASSLRRVPATSHSSKPSFSMRRTDDDDARPPTAASSDTRRRRTDPLHSIRDSLFGGKKKASRDGDDASATRPTSRGSEQLPHDAPMYPTVLQSEEQCQMLRDLKRQSFAC